MTTPSPAARKRGSSGNPSASPPVRVAHSAVAEMLKARETEILRIVAIDADGVLAPCGRCRELIVQVDRRNLDCEVILPGGTISTMADLLPRAWLEPLFARE